MIKNILVCTLLAMVTIGDTVVETVTSNSLRSMDNNDEAFHVAYDDNLQLKMTRWGNWGGPDVEWCA